MFLNIRIPRMLLGIIRLFYTFVILGAYCQNEFCTALRVQTVPANFDPYSTDKINITCIPDDPNYWAIDVVTLEFKKNDQEPIAVLQKTGLTTGPGIKSNVQAEGFIKKDASQSWLQLTINRPSAENAGTYSCIMFYLDESFNMKKEMAYANVTVDKPDLAAIVTNLMERMSSLEKLVKSQEDVNLEQGHQLKLQQDYITQQNLIASGMNKTLREQDFTITNQMKQLKDQENKQKSQDIFIHAQNDLINSLQGKLDSLKKKLQNQDRRNVNQQKQLDAQCDVMTGLRREIADQGTQLQKEILHTMEQDKNASFMSAFLAGYDAKDTFQAGDTLIFRTPLLAIGEAYNFSSGVYTAPRSGIYVFSLSVYLYTVGWVYIDIKTNEDSVATVHGEFRHYWDQTSLSTVVSLKEGDKVRPTVTSTNGIHTLFSNMRTTQFSGYLLRLQ